MAFENATFKVTGLTPLLVHNPAGMFVHGAVGIKKKPPTPEEEAKGYLYLNEKGQYCFPILGFRASLISAMKGMKMKENRMSGINYVSAVLQPPFTEGENFKELVILVDPKTGKPLHDYAIDTRRVVIQGSGIARSRPRFNSWGCELQFQVDTERSSPEFIEEQLNRAGMISGIGDFRPNRQGIFGRYRVELIK